MNGLQLTADLYGCRVAADPAHGDLMLDAHGLAVCCREAVRAAGLTPVGEVFHPFDRGGGVTGVILLAESHLAVHTWPEQQAVTIDLYVCNFSGDNSRAAQALMRSLIDRFAPERCVQQRLVRGSA